MLRSAQTCVIASIWAASRAMSTSSSRTQRAAIAQLTSTSDKLKNLFNVARCAGMAQKEGACMLFLPECFGFMGTSSKQTLEQAEPPLAQEGRRNEKAVSDMLRAAVRSAHGDDPGDSDEASKIPETHDEDGPNTVLLLDGLKTIASESGLWISGGGMHVSGAKPREDDETQTPRVYNTHVVLDCDGNVKCYYRKIHLFDVSIPNKVNLRESATTAPGTELVVCDSPIGRLGLSTCYDVRFPEMYTDLVRKGNAEILLVPSAFTVPTGSAHWHTLLKARAIESQCYVLAAAQYGQHNEKRESYGHSLAVDPWGEIVADAGGCDGQGTSGSTGEITTPSIVTCDIELDRINSIKERMPIQRHRDNSTYSFPDI